MTKKAKHSNMEHLRIYCFFYFFYFLFFLHNKRERWGRCGSGGKSSRLAVGGLPVRSHPGRVEVSLSRTPNPRLLLTSWLVPCLAANRHWCVNVCVNGWMRGIHCTALWIKALYKCSPFTIYLKHQLLFFCCCKSI